MNNARYLLIVAGVSAGVLGGCDIFVDRDPFGAHPLIAQDELEDIDLARVLSAGEFTMDASKSEPRKREELELAFADFNRQLDRMPVAADRRLARNRVQERILAGSNQACGDYKHELKQLDAEVNFFLGSLTTGLPGRSRSSPVPTSSGRCRGRPASPAASAPSSTRTSSRA